MLDLQKKFEENAMSLVEKALENGNPLFDKENDIYNYNKMFDHIFEMLQDSLLLFCKKSFNTSCFLSITAIEEIAKAEMALYIKTKKDVKRGQNPLFNHSKKHQIAVVPTVFMGKRLNEALGEDVCLSLKKELLNGGFRDVREACLYCDNIEGSFITPQKAISDIRAWQMLMIAIETLDDRLIGYTHESISKSDVVDELFTKSCSVKPVK